MITIDLKQLRVLHRLKDAAGHGMDDDCAESFATQGLYVDTCLRQVSIIADASITKTFPIDTETDVLHGHDAYSFLLQTITGLNSAIPGETNVLGQFRCAWKRWLKTAHTEQIKQLNPLLLQLFTDGKQIRQDYLENTGGASYGSLVRKILQPETKAHILFVGAGKLSLSMLPLFTAWQTALWNHRLHKGLRVDHNALIFSPKASNDAADWASQLVLTTPANEDNDSRWLELANKHQISHVVHLGIRRAEPGIWQHRPDTLHFHDLDDIFDLRQHQQTLRDNNVVQARHACENIAHRFAPHKSMPLNVQAQP
ncbi:MAG: hypothetical protein GY727_13785 [Gammaproteobacteria bacterium]|nr:hypothetical protein [Gammaproteobacteria bacterium]MCP4089824.1 hypothetical protein [Gammaproteobacteria bacterium]MCP4275348.1 hypothetical protein [Gammaproteobacteria bacterium]MCP4831239.1 hypothetical protein [Gammaproteobacteria bacterium]MCP4927650.1 hypothetical protein [Gammaproteobacteria bacterium]